MVSSSALLLYLLAAPAALALSLPESSPLLRGSLATPHGVDSISVTKRFASAYFDANLTYVENSGICETPGVHQVSGYLTVGEHMHMVSAFFVAVFIFQLTFLFT